MRLLTDVEIKEMNIVPDGVMEKVSKLGDIKIASYGLEPLGYTFRASTEGEINGRSQTCPLTSCIQIEKTEDTIRTFFYLYPGDNVKLFTVEAVVMPSDVTILNFTGKTTYICREFLVLHSTQVEPGYHGRLVIGLTNLNTKPVKIYFNEGILQANFIRVEEPPKTSYEGHYQGGGILKSVVSSA